MAGESLQVVAGNAAGSNIALHNELVIGRSTPGLGSLGGDSEISRVHARVFHDPSGQLTVEDLGSTNGTFVNRNRIPGATPLRPAAPPPRRSPHPRRRTGPRPLRRRRPRHRAASPASSSQASPVARSAVPP